ncbi:helix-turn-helix transcriptional regulator [Humibacter ginsengiterrae]
MGVHQPAGRRTQSLMENLIRAEREGRGWTQATLAERLDVSRQTVVALETGKYDPSLPLAFRISRLFGKPIEELFTPAGR